MKPSYQFTENKNIKELLKWKYVKKIKNRMKEHL